MPKTKRKLFAIENRPEHKSAQQLAREAIARHNKKEKFGTATIHDTGAPTLDVNAILRASERKVDK